MKTLFFIMLLMQLSYGFMVKITFQNLLSTPSAFTLKKGQIFEASDVTDTTQNMAVVEDRHVLLQPGEIQDVVVEMRCIDSHLEPAPVGTRVRVTPALVPRRAMDNNPSDGIDAAIERARSTAREVH